MSDLDRHVYCTIITLQVVVQQSKSAEKLCACCCWRNCLSCLDFTLAAQKQPGLLGSHSLPSAMHQQWLLSFHYEAEQMTDSDKKKKRLCKRPASNFAVFCGCNKTNYNWVKQRRNRKKRKERHENCREEISLP